MTSGIVETYAFGIPLAELPRYRVKPLLTPTDKTERSEGLNYELLDEILAYIKAHPKTWAQASWFKTVDTNSGEEKYVSRIETVEELNSCGTAFCFAGHVAMREGFPAPPLNNEDEWTRLIDPSASGRDYDTYESVETFAQKRLGISNNQAYALFAGENSMEDLERMVLLLHANPEVESYTMRGVAEQNADEFLETLIGELVAGAASRKTSSV